MLMDNKFEYGVPYENYQMIEKGREFWEVFIPANLTIDPIIYHWIVLDEVRFGWNGCIEVKLYEICKKFNTWLEMEHILKTHYFKTKEEAEEYKKWYLEQLKVADEKNFEEKSAYNYYNLSKSHFSQFLLCYEKCNSINVKENKDLKLALEYIDKAIELKPNVALYYDARSEILNILGYSNESLKDSFMASTLKDK